MKARSLFIAAGLAATLLIAVLPATAQLRLDVALTYPPPPWWIIPEGCIVFQISAVNHGPIQAPFVTWCRIKYPYGTYTAPTVGPITVNPPVGTTISRWRTQSISSSWPAGVYTYLAYVNMTYGYPAIDSAFFTFTILADRGTGPDIGEVSCTGEPFPGEALCIQPSDFGLVTASPNPFNPTTTISYELRDESLVNLKVYDTAGRLVATLVDGWRDAGTHEVTFDGSRLASGVYLYTLQAGGKTVTGKMMLVK